MIRSSRPVVRVAAVGALALALGLTLSACGRKGPLDPPPGASLYEQPTAAQPDINPEGRPLGAGEVPTDTRPVAPPGQKRRLPIDWLLD